MVIKIIEIIVRIISNIFVFIFKLFDAKILGIIKKIENGFIVPPVKYNKKLSWNMSIIRKLSEALLDNWVFLKKKIKKILLIAPNKTIILDNIKLNSNSKINFKEFVDFFYKIDWY